MADFYKNEDNVNLDWMAANTFRIFILNFVVMIIISIFGMYAATARNLSDFNILILYIFLIFTLDNNGSSLQ